MTAGLGEAFGLLLTGESETWSIIGRSIGFAFCSTIFSFVPGVLLGFAASSLRSKWRRGAAAVINALTAIPTVVVGLFVYSLISRSGPLGFLGFLYAPGGVVMGQTFLATPIVASLSYAGLAKLDPRFRETLLTLGAGRWRRLIATAREARTLMVAAVVSAFGRVTGEVGVCMMLGGNIRGTTRTMTTAIALDASKGDFEIATALGIVLFFLAVFVNLAVHALAPREG
jgi:tungstate transport system permease protein